MSRVERDRDVEELSKEVENDASLKVCRELTEKNLEVIGI